MTTQRKISASHLARVGAIVADATGCDELPEILRSFVKGLVGLTGADRAALLFEDGGKLVTCYTDEGSQHLLGQEVPLEGSLEGKCYRAGHPVISHDVSRDHRFEGLEHAEDELALITVPLHLDGPPVGLIRLVSSEPGAFGGHSLMVARLVVASMRKVLLQSLRTERESLGIFEKDFAIAGVWALRDRRTAQLRSAGEQGPAVTLVRYEISGYLTSDIVRHIATVVRSSDHVFQDDAGTFTLILTGTAAADAEAVALRVKNEIETLAEAGGDPIRVDWKVTELRHDEDHLRTA